MSQQYPAQQQSVRHVPVEPPRRPGTLTAAMAATAIAALSLIIGAITVFAGGKDAVRSLGDDYIADQAGITKAQLASIKSVAGGLYDDAINQAYSSFSARAGFGLFFAICLLLLAIAVRNAAIWARVLIAVAGLFTATLQLLVVSDIGPMAVRASGMVAIIGCLAAIVLCWLPANNRYLRVRKAAR